MLKPPTPRPGGPVTCQTPHTEEHRAPYTIRLMVVVIREDGPPVVTNHLQHSCTVCTSQLVRWIAEDTQHRHLTGLAGPYDEGIGSGFAKALSGGFGNSGTGVW